MSEIKCSLENEGFLAHYYQGNKEKNKEKGFYSLVAHKIV